MQTLIDILVLLLAVVDIAALVIGISIRRTVTKIVRDTAADIETAVKAGIADAVRQFASLAKTILAGTGKETPLLDHADQLIDQLK